jgi:hypothetical protein
VTRHPFDPISFTVGVLALAAGAVVLAGGTLTDEARLLLPAGLIAVGVALLAKVLDRPDRTLPPSAGVATAAEPSTHPSGPADPLLDLRSDLPPASDPPGGVAADPSADPADPAGEPSGEPSGEPAPDPDADQAG